MNDTTENPTPDDESDEALDAEAKNSSPDPKATPEKPPLGPTPDDFEMSNPGNIDPEVLQNISVSLAIEVGRTQIKIKDWLNETLKKITPLLRAIQLFLFDFLQFLTVESRPHFCALSP